MYISSSDPRSPPISISDLPLGVSRGSVSCLSKSHSHDSALGMPRGKWNREVSRGYPTSRLTPRTPGEETTEEHGNVARRPCVGGAGRPRPVRGGIPTPLSPVSQRPAFVPGRVVSEVPSPDRGGGVTSPPAISVPVFFVKDSIGTTACDALRSTPCRWLPRLCDNSRRCARRSRHPAPGTS